MENSFPFQEDDEGTFLLMKSQVGVFELRPYDTYIFEPLQLAHSALRHVYHIIDETDDGYNGFYIWRKHLTEAGLDFDEFVDGLVEHDYHVETFDEPDPRDILSWEEHHGREYVPELPDYTSLQLGKMSLSEMLNVWHDARDAWFDTDEAKIGGFDSEFEYYLGEGGEWNGTTE